MKGAWGIIENGMIPRMIKEGVCVSLGTDTNGAAGSLDMFRQLFLVAIAHRESHGDPTLIGPYKALEMATIDGARARLWDSDIGSLQPGKCADIVIVATGGPEWQHAGRDIVRKIVYCATGSSVETVIIDGKIVMRDREILTLDEERLKHDVAEAGQLWMEKAGYSVSAAWPELQRGSHAGSLA